ncbi:hypothetical protein ACWGCW_28810 [Streptomyces sp. NPDC054933]|jgi:hypothetical protein
MTEKIPPPLGASPTVRPMRTRHDLVLRLHDALHEHGGFTARVLPGPLAITYSGYAVATDAARVQLPAHATSAALSCVVGMPLGQHPHIRAIRARQHGGRIDLEPVEVFAPHGAEHRPDDRPRLASTWADQ